MPNEAPKPYHEKRPWGEFVRFTQNTPSTVKIITVNPGQALSLQKHAHREEFWHVLSGDGFATIGTERIPLHPGDNHFTPHETAHQLEAGVNSLIILEIALGDFDENDIVRLEDRYGRSGNTS